MGIDIYMHWRNQTKKEREAQWTGFAVDEGVTGYLREAYHGSPYATRVLVPEAFVHGGGGDDGVPIPASTLRERLSEVLQVAVVRANTVYGKVVGPDEYPPKSFAEFVELAERKEAETGEPVKVYASY